MRSSEYWLARWIANKYQGNWLIGPSWFRVLMAFVEDHMIDHIKYKKEIYDKFSSHSEHLKIHWEEGKYARLNSVT